MALHDKSKSENAISKLHLFEEQQLRTIWNSEQEKWYISIVDVIAVLTESRDPSAYWRKLKQRLKAEGNETVTNCHSLKMVATDGKMRITDVADTEQLFRLIQSIPSPKAEPFKLWLAQLAAERLDELQDPELSIDRALEQYLKLGYSENWINQRLKSIEIRKELTDEWKKRGLKEGLQFATLTDIITKAWSDKTTKEYKVLKGLKKENLRDNMTNTELILNMLAEASTKDISAATNPKDFEESKIVAKQGGNVAKVARMELEAKTGKKVVSKLNAKDVLKSIENDKNELTNYNTTNSKNNE
ncbi:MAG: Bro-N domain-containing protein [Flavobacteriales bacterium]|nr:Bro-N domain-containing protein [Flavobacteriales bacterium]